MFINCKTIRINIVVTKGNAGYRVLKLAGGHGDHEIRRPVDV